MLLEWDYRSQSPAIFPRKILSTTPTPCCPFSARDNHLFSHRQRYALQQQNQTKSEKMRWRCYSRRRGVILHTWSNVEAFFFYFFFFRSRLPGTCISHANTHTHGITKRANYRRNDVDDGAFELDLFWILNANATQHLTLWDAIWARKRSQTHSLT